MDRLLYHHVHFRLMHPGLEGTATEVDCGKKMKVSRIGGLLPLLMDNAGMNTMEIEREMRK
jgi:hypothetical protein